MPESTESPLPDRIAAVDLGSNSFHLVIARVVRGEPRMLDSHREPVRLAEGLHPKKGIAPAARERALACLERFGQRLRDLPPDAVRAVGTNTLRSARDSRRFLEEAREALGHEIEVIAGAEEARLIYLGVAHTLSDDEGRRLVVDIGGGSTEIIIGKRFETKKVESLFMGCVHWSQRFFFDGTIGRKAFQEAILAAQAELQTVQRRLRKIGWVDAVGASGTIRAAAGVIRAAGWEEGRLNARSLKKLRQAMISLGHVDALKSLEGLKPERAPVFPGGIAVLSALFESLRIEDMKLAKGALREGVLYEILGRERHEDVRERTIADLQTRLEVDLDQASRVERTALDLFGTCDDAAEMGGETAAEFLAWAARLHEAGIAVAHRHYHRHGAYLIENSDLPGFSNDDKALLAYLVGSHRRKLQPGSVDALPTTRRFAARRLALLLRLACLLNRGRSSEPLPEIKVQFRWSKSRMTVEIPEAWLHDHQLTRLDLEQEKDLLERSGIRLKLVLEGSEAPAEHPGKDA